ncbi:MAG: TonB family protein [Verrucomicrobiota bacterium]
MERLQKKCFVGSLASHGILIVVLAVGTAMGPQTFKSMKQEEQFVDIKVIDVGDVTDGPSQQGGGGGGGSPAAPAQAPAPAPQPTPPPPQPEPVTPPPAIVEAPKPPPIEAVVVPPPDTRTSLRPPENNKKKAPKDEPKKEVKADAPTKKEAPKKVEVKVNLAKVDRSKTTDAEAKQKAAAEAAKAQKAADAKAIRDARARQNAINQAIGSSFDGLQKNLSQAGTGLDIASFGAGSGKGWGVGSGPTLMNYAQYVREIYDLNWIVTDAVVGDSGVVRVEIVVQRNGAARGKIVKSSGNAMLDRSVQSALDKVKNIGRPFPEGATDSSRTFTINFNLTSKRGTG